MSLRGRYLNHNMFNTEFPSGAKRELLKEVILNKRPKQKALQRKPEKMCFGLKKTVGIESGGTKWLHMADSEN